MNGMVSMTREDIVRMARSAGVLDDEHRFEFGEYKDLEFFAVLVASAERKECEKIIWNADAWIGSDAKIWLVKSIQEARGNTQ